MKNPYGDTESAVGSIRAAEILRSKGVAYDKEPDVDAIQLGLELGYLWPAKNTRSK